MESVAIVTRAPTAVAAPMRYPRPAQADSQGPAALWPATHATSDDWVALVLNPIAEFLSRVPLAMELLMK